MAWTVTNHDEFETEFDALPEAVQDELLALASLLETYGPALGRPHVDTLAGSMHANMKELRFNAADGVWRVAFAFQKDGPSCSSQATSPALVNGASTNR